MGWRAVGQGDRVNRVRVRVRVGSGMDCGGRGPTHGASQLSQKGRSAGRVLQLGWL